MYKRQAREGRYAGILSEGPEFETLYSLGGATGVDNLDAVIAGDRLCDELGLDTMSAGVTIGFAMELYEKGILSEKDTGGIKLNFGNDEAMMDLLLDMAYRRGLGELLADGVKIAAARIGKGSEKYALHIKGLELPALSLIHIYINLCTSGHSVVPNSLINASRKANSFSFPFSNLFRASSEPDVYKRQSYPRG